MERIAQRLGFRQGTTTGPPSVTNYILLVLNARVAPDKQGRRNREELAMIAASLDSLASSAGTNNEFDASRAQVADQLMQRFKSIEQAILDGGDWFTAENMGILPEEAAGVATQEEKEASIASRLSEARFLEAKEKLGGRRKGANKKKE
jgi:hypothetical protein